MVCRVSHPGDLPGGTRGQRPETDPLSRTGLSPSLAGRSRHIPLTISFLSLRRGAAAPPSRLTTPLPQRLPAITRKRFGLFPFRSPLLRECFLFLEVLRCFSSLGALHALYEFKRG